MCQEPFYWRPDSDDFPTSQGQTATLLVNMHKRRRIGTLLALGDKLPEDQVSPGHSYKNIIKQALKVHTYAEEHPEKKRAQLAIDLKISHTLVSEYRKIIRNLPPEFIEQMKKCKNQTILSIFSGVQLLEIAALPTMLKRETRIEELLKKNEISGKFFKML